MIYIQWSLNSIHEISNLTTKIAGYRSLNFVARRVPEEVMDLI